MFIMCENVHIFSLIVQEVTHRVQPDQQLEDDCTLSDYNVQEENTVYRDIFPSQGNVILSLLLNP